MVYKSEMTHEVSHFRKFGEFTVKVPWPWWHRSTYIKVGATPVEGEPAIIIVMKSLSGNKWIKDIEIKKDDQTTEVNVNFCTAFIETLDENV